MLTEKDYCDYETCVALEELGFPLHPYGNTEIDTSLRLTLLLYEAQKWLREEKELFVEVVMSCGKYDFDICSTKLEQDKTHKILCEICGYETYEEALLEGVRRAVKLLKEK